MDYWMDNPKSAVACRWRIDNDCTLDGAPAMVVGWKNRFATVVSLNDGVTFDWAWETVNSIMENKERQFYS